MITLVIGELVATALASVVFIIMFARSGSGLSSPNVRVRAAARNMIAVSGVWAAETISLAAIGLGIPVPLWIFALGFGAGALVMVHRITLLFRARHPTRKEPDHV